SAFEDKKQFARGVSCREQSFLKNFLGTRNVGDFRDVDTGWRPALRDSHGLRSALDGQNRTIRPLRCGNFRGSFHRSQPERLAVPANIQHSANQLRTCRLDRGHDCLRIWDEQQAVQELHRGCGRDSDLPTFDAEQLYRVLVLVKRFKNLVEDLLRLTRLETKDFVLVVTDPSVSAFPVGRISETQKLFVVDPFHDLPFPALRQPHTRTDIYVLVDVVLLDLNE